MEGITMPTEKPRYTVIVDEELLRQIDDFRFENRYPSRSAATLDLIRLGFEALEKRRETHLISSTDETASLRI